LANWAGLTATVTLDTNIEATAGTAIWAGLAATVDVSEPAGGDDGYRPRTFRRGRRRTIYGG
jgi:hypothetical protein